MSILRIDPFRGFDSLTRKMNTIINDLDKGFNVEYGSFAPRVDIIENTDSLHITAELPGVNKEDVKVSISDDNVLVLKGTKARNNVEKKENESGEITYLRAERSYGEFTRQFLLPDNADKSSIAAKYDNGVLNIHLKKTEPEKPKEVEISIE